MNPKNYGTHAAKMFDSSIKQFAMVANMAGKPPKHFISSQSVKGRELWAMPFNAADMATAKAVCPKTLPVYLPDFMDGRLKQILLPYRDGYLAAAPVPSAKVHYELFCALKDKPYRSWLIQPVMAAWSSHGESVLAQKGRFRLLMTRVRMPTMPFVLPEKAVCVSFRCERMNIAGGMAAVGAPAITAIGGLVHAIERSFGSEVHFAVGFEWVNWHSRARGANYQRKTPMIKLAVNKIMTDEVTGSGKVHLILKSDKEGLAEHMRANPFNRFAGGTVWDFSVQTGGEIFATFLCDNSKHLVGADDVLAAAIKLYETEDTWGECPKLISTYGINHVGYGLLETPKQRAKARKGYPSAWVEPLFGAVVLTDNPDNLFWRRVEYDGAVIWQQENKEPL